MSDYTEFPLTPNQQGLLFHCLAAEAERPYFIQEVFDVHEGVDVEILRRAWAHVVARHDVLRSCINWEGISQPLMVIRDELTLPFRVTSLRGLSPVDQQARLDAFLREDRRRGFDFTKAPLHRMKVFDRGPDSAWVILTI